MAMRTGEIERVSDLVTERMAELLGARVSVVDERGALIASSEPAPGGWTALGDEAPPADDAFRVPMTLGPGTAQVVIQPVTGERVSPRLAQTLVEWMFAQTTAVARLANQHELKDKFINDLLCGTQRDEDDILREAQILGMDLTRPRAVILVDAADYILDADHLGRLSGCEARTRRRAQSVINVVVRFFNLPDQTICAYIGDGEVAVLKASSTEDLVAWADGERGWDQMSPSWADLAALKRASNELLARLRRETGAPVSLGIGRYHPGIRGLARSYQDARAALSLGRRFHGRNGVHCLDGLGVAAFVGVSDERTKVDLAMHLLSPLDHEPELLQTLDAFFAEDCCPSSVAKRLAIHRNTLSYRLDKITALTGLDPRAFDDAVQIRLALLLRSL
ncbi:MAG TPA: helix-turn-helix domain-containing protein [Chloroflexota bacterium]|nr:helix-turn-helix domain-containing protein [Chloroflexota bacterium]